MEKRKAKKIPFDSASKLEAARMGVTPGAGRPTLARRGRHRNGIEKDKPVSGPGHDLYPP